MAGQTLKIDDLPVGRFHIKIAALTFGAHFTDGYILGLVGIALTLITPQMDLSPAWQGLVAASALFGLFVGSLFFGWLSDRMGRQKIFLVSFALITLASALQFFADTPMQLFICRLLLGIALGGDFCVGHAMLAEFSPKRHRGTLLGSFSVIWTFGYVAATVVGTLMLSWGPDAWRWMLASSAVPAFLVLVFRIGTPESPRWLVHQGRIEEARAIVHKHLGPHVELDDEIGEPEHAGFGQLFSRRYLTRTVFNCLFFVCIVMPYFAIYTFLPVILKTMNLSEGLGTEILLNALLVVGALIGIGCTIKFSRRGFLINSFLILAASLFLLAIMPGNLAWLMVGLFGVFTLVLSAVSNLVGVYPAESFPTELRASGIGLATACSRLSSGLSTFLLPVSVAGLGLMPTMGMLAAILLLGAIISIAWAPETKALSLTAAGRAIIPDPDRRRKPHGTDMDLPAPQRAR
ncbi:MULTISPECIES: MFS transporter [unclassified Pseudomonas]|uniref:MFS transporter n=1 Tax=unclassified Pseudomonas TaxID=196821 RepID=UPI000BC7AEFA|nr:MULTISPECIES: MFS transporter [unclassified Pseudomonas]PVZ20381.1 putative MFS transporter [Pseudomonas sp. URIL14HWK12:I12]PVZ27447.1 putative MFS transporter [Pseudomonas sp. URIL14HWK12:I10]PVZ38336.1 putative MFS transporter [Pseudomonas sp. URIL14HWK12:I11]SNZ03765.1 MFS transporter, putative metabolite transport protein [Pseudomonas sp. URIL14HWK12:I9]